jgi:hypothetical protein
MRVIVSAMPLLLHLHKQVRKVDYLGRKPHIFKLLAFLASNAMINSTIYLCPRAFCSVRGEGAGTR